jgi:DNA-binding response OmpR family regulator
LAPDKDITILAMANDPIFLGALVEFLETEGYKSRSITNSHIAINRIRETVPDLVICDLDMSLVDSISIVNQLRNDPNPIVSGVPFIFLADRYPTGNVIKDLSLEIDDLIVKPFTFHELQERIKGALR